jgi:polyhydroxyalkanoic acid synthase PhaR subunit
MKQKTEPEPASPPADPFQVWREWLDRSERQWNDWLAEAMESEHFGHGSKRLLDLAMELQSSMNSATHRYFTLLNVPTRGDVLQLGERLGAIEERLSGIEEALAAARAGSGSTKTQARTAAARPKPKRTRRPPTKS